MRTKMKRMLAVSLVFAMSTTMFHSGFVAKADTTDVFENNDFEGVESFGALHETEESLSWMNQFSEGENRNRFLKRSEAASLPEYVDNSESEYFPAIMNQKGGSCSSYSSVYYQFTYTMNQALGRSS